MKSLISIAILSSFLFANQDLPATNINTIITANKKFEPSGVTLNDNKLYSISDNGIILKYDLESKIQEYTKINKKDYEDITFSKDGKKLFLVEEGKDNVIELSTDSFDTINKFDIDRTFNGEVVINKESNGLESLSYIREDEKNLYFYSANQSKKFEGSDRSSIMLLEIDKLTLKGKILEYFPMDIKDISSIDYKNDNLIYFISDTENTLFITDKNFKNLKKYNLPGENQEGIYLDENTMILYIAQDSGDILEVNLKEELK